MPGHYRTIVDVAIFIANNLIAVMVAAGSMVIAIRQRVTSGWVWVGLASVALLSGIAGIHVHDVPPYGAFRAGSSFSLINLAYVDGHPSLSATITAVALRATTLFAITAATYYALRQRAIPAHVGAR